MPSRSSQHAPPSKKKNVSIDDSSAGNLPFVSVIIPCYNTEETLREVLESIATQTYSAFEVIAVDDGSTDHTKKIIEDFPSVKLIAQKNKGSSSARNAAIRAAKGDIILLQDADAKVFPGWIARHAEMQQKDFLIVGGSVVPWNNSFWGMCDHYSTWYEYHPEKTFQRDRHQISSTNLSVRASVFEKAGLFDEGLNARLEDVEFSRRAIRNGYSIAFDPRNPMAHHDRQSLQGFLHHHYKYGKYAPFVRTRESGAKFAWLIPQNTVEAFLMILPLAILHTGFVVYNWLPFHPEVFLYSPLVFLSKLAHAIGVYDGVKEKTKIELEKANKK